MNLFETATETEKRLLERGSDGISEIANSKLDPVSGRFDPVDQVGREYPVSDVGGDQDGAKAARASGHGGPVDDRRPYDDSRVGVLPTVGNDVADSGVQSVVLTDAPPRDSHVVVRRLAGGIATALLRIFGGGRIDQVVECVDRIREQALGSFFAAEQRVITEARRWLVDRHQLRLVSPLEPDNPDDRLAALLWATHGAFPPRIADAVLLRALCAAPADEVAALIPGTATDQIGTLVARAGRRSRALGLEFRRPGPREYRLGLKAAEQRLRALLRRATRSKRRSFEVLGGVLADWIDLVNDHGKPAAGRR